MTKRALARFVSARHLLGASALASIGACAPETPLPDFDFPFTESRSVDATRPRFPVTVTQASPPPPISGGTLTIAPDGATAVVADPDRDRIYVVDLPSRSVVHDVALPPQSEPGRIAVDDRGRAYVVLRRAGGLAQIDLTTGALVHRDACAHPRGVAFDPLLAALRVTCATGELLTVPRDEGPIRSELWRGELRDVVLLPSGPIVTHFRAATLHTSVGVLRTSLPRLSVAWRTIALPHPGASDHDEIAFVAQGMPTAPLPPNSWGAAPSDPCASTPEGILGTMLSLVQVESNVLSSGSAKTSSVFLPRAVLPVDLASNGREIVVVAAGNAYAPGQSQLFTVAANRLRAPSGCDVMPATGNVPGQAVAAAFAGDDALIVQTREPAALHIMGPDRRSAMRSIRLSDESRADTGHALFHTNAGGTLACASCHPEGADDGQVWTFQTIGDRRTPSLLGTLANTAPYHWQGELSDMRELVDQVFSSRMGGTHLDGREIDALRDWLVALPARAPMRLASGTTLRGAATFRARCERCHAGPELTNNETVDVGTGGSFQVPSLRGLAWRAPYLHSGCAKTLRGRFDPQCGGTAHGDQGLTNDQIDDLVTFLETL